MLAEIKLLEQNELLTNCKRETKKTIKYDKKCRMRRTVEPSLKMSQPGLKRQKSGKWVFFTSLSFA